MVLVARSRSLPEFNRYTTLVCNRNRYVTKTRLLYKIDQLKEKINLSLPLLPISWKKRVLRFCDRKQRLLNLHSYELKEIRESLKLVIRKIRKAKKFRIILVETLTSPGSRKFKHYEKNINPLLDYANQIWKGQVPELKGDWEVKYLPRTISGQTFDIILERDAGESLRKASVYVIGELYVRGTYKTIHLASQLRHKRNKSITHCVLDPDFVCAITKNYRKQDETGKIHEIDKIGVTREEYRLLAELFMGSVPSLLSPPYVACEPDVRKLLAIFPKMQGDLWQWMYYHKSNLHSFLSVGYQTEYQFLITCLFDIALALQNLHRRNYIHGDIKLDNFFLPLNNENGSWAVLGDLGLACHPGERKNHEVYAKAYRPIELMEEGGMVNFSSDIWALGVSILYLCYFGYFINEKNMMFHQGCFYNLLESEPISDPRRLLQLLPLTDNPLEVNMQRLIYLMLQENPLLRPPIEIVVDILNAMQYEDAAEASQILENWQMRIEEIIAEIQQDAVVI